MSDTPGKITMWTQAGCPRCEEMKKYLLAKGYEVEEKSADLADLTNEPADIRSTVMADLQIQNDALPLVYAGNEVLDHAYLDDCMAAERAGHGR